ncbi:aromatic/alkene monooxygenase hydroxylase subunit beta [Sinimarinibacterium sp. NLF-5-8]|uniref:aromatic/alkene monooxygenase hydroxylase subunit beta n=1 Tax=Sinimarinibacterium sp. NLF-5-8 TaxID=2698684 RepID=UPI00137C0831|nr:aromatic/alkene monooxygenase hydroxylase subunit beta [Sinimarinibacterium sp. NLF-5-8]QHS11083.1 phenol hydroxylase [Sinimarinibacterium sp. NLF-5-8]
MQIDIKTTTVEPIRQTFSHVARRLGADKPASRYQEATFDLQTTTNFHYRPLWDQDRELYDVRRTAIVMKDWYALKDPRQFYYGTYTVTRARQQETMEKNIDFVDKRGLLREWPEAVRNALIFALVPLRHLEWGGNTNNCYITAYGWGTAVTQATMFHTMDRLGIAQYLSRIGLLMDGNTGDSLAQAKTLWMEHASWQGLRRLAEELMVTRDWFELFVAQNLVLDGLVYPLVFQRYEQHVTAAQGPTLSLLVEFMNQWFDETSRWVDASVKGVAAESTANAAQLAIWIGAWRDRALAALTPYAAELFGDGAVEQLEKVTAIFAARAAKLGIQLEEMA